MVVKVRIRVTLHRHHTNNRIFHNQRNSHPDYRKNRALNPAFCRSVFKCFFLQQNRPSLQHNQTGQRRIRVKIGYCFVVVIHCVDMIGKMQGAFFAVDNSDKKISDIDNSSQRVVDGTIKILQIQSGVYRIGNFKQDSICFFTFFSRFFRMFAIDRYGDLMRNGCKDLQVMMVEKIRIRVALQRHYTDNRIFHNQRDSHPDCWDRTVNPAFRRPVFKCFFPQQNRSSLQYDQTGQRRIRVKIGYRTVVFIHYVDTIGKMQDAFFDVDNGDKKIGDIDNSSQRLVDGTIKILQI